MLLNDCNCAANDTHTHTHTHTHTRTHTHTHAYAHAHTHTRAHICAHTTHAHVHTHMHPPTHTHTHALPSPGSHSHWWKMPVCCVTSVLLLPWLRPPWRTCFTTFRRVGVAGPRAKWRKPMKPCSLLLPSCVGQYMESSGGGGGGVCLDIIPFLYSYNYRFQR